MNVEKTIGDLESAFSIVKLVEFFRGTVKNPKNLKWKQVKRGFTLPAEEAS